MKFVYPLQRLPGYRAVRGVSVVVFAMLAWAAVSNAADTAEGVAFFEKRIRPVLVEKCYSCHSAEAKKVQGGLLLDTREGIRRGGDRAPAVVPGDPTRSVLLEAISYQDEDFAMPPQEKLPASVIEDFERWIRMGAPDPREGKPIAKGGGIDLEEGRKFWSFQPISKPPVPTPEDQEWPRTDIDRFIRAGLQSKGLEPVGDADRATLIRRVTFDLTGLPSTPEEVDAFVRDGSPRAFEVLVDRLLESPRFGERWGRHWLDVARYAESSGSAHNVPFPLAFRYRDYVIDAFNKDKPYDQFIREQLAGDLLPAASDAQRNEQLLATGFLAVGVKDLRERNNHRYLMSIVEEQIDTTSRAVLGLTIACARCHDHKFDPIPTRDYYALAGIFSSTEPLLGVMRPRYADPLTTAVQPLAGRPVSFTDADMASMLKQSVQLTVMRLGIRDDKRRLLLAAGKTTAKAKEQEAIWAAAPSVIERQKKLAEADASYHALVDRYNAALAHSAMAAREVKQPADCAVHVRGEDSQLGEVVPRGFPAVLTTAATPTVDPSQSGRRQLAEWIASPENPLTARVMVNRIWLHLMGAGLVETPDDFGKTGQAPSNPALLDHLAQRFIGHGWSVKKMIREITLSRVYQLASTHQAAAHEIDPANRLRWRMNRRRLDANAIRDALLAISGQLDLRRPPERIPPWVNDPRVKSLDTKNWLGAAARHRTVHLPMLREYIPDDLSVFDFPEPELVTGQRDVTTVPTQALYLLNSPFIVEQAKKAAERLLANPATEDHVRVRHAYALILGRPPEPQELADAVTFVEQFSSRAEAGKNIRTAAWAALCQALFASGEFRYLY